MRLRLHRVVQTQRFVGFQRNQLRQFVAQGKRQFQHAPHVANHRFRRHRAESNNLADRLRAVFLAHILNHAAAVALAKIHVEVGHGNAFGVQETLEQQRVFERVEVGNLQRIRHQRTRARTASRPHRTAVRFCPVDKVLYDKEIAGEFHLDDDVQLKIQPLLIFRHFRRPLRLVGIKLNHAFLQALVGQFHQIIVQRQAVGRREQGQEVFAQRDMDIAAFGDFHRVFQGFGQVGETLQHRFRRNEKLARRKIARTFLVRQHPAARDAHPRLVRIEIIAAHKLRRMRRHHRQTQLLRQLHAARNASLPFGTLGQTLQLQIKRIRKPRRILQRRRTRRVFVAVQKIHAHFAVMRTAQTNQAAVVAVFQPFGIEFRMMDIAVFADISRRQKLAQAQIARIVADNQHGAERLVWRIRIAYPHIRRTDGLNPRAAAGFIEFHQTEFVHQITDAQSRQTIFLRFGNQFFNPHHTVGNRKLGMQAQRDVGRLGHGKIGVNNKRRIVAGLAGKGRLKTNKVSFAKTSAAGFAKTSMAGSPKEDKAFQTA